VEDVVGHVEDLQLQYLSVHGEMTLTPSACIIQPEREERIEIQKKAELSTVCNLRN